MINREIEYTYKHNKIHYINKRRIFLISTLQNILIIEVCKSLKNNVVVAMRCEV